MILLSGPFVILIQFKIEARFSNEQFVIEYIFFNCTVVMSVKVINSTAIRKSSKVFNNSFLASYHMNSTQNNYIC